MGESNPTILPPDALLPVDRWTFSGWRLAPSPPSAVIGQYYVDSDRNIELGQEKATYYCSPSQEEPNFDLNEGFEDWEDWTDGTREKLDIFLKWLSIIGAGKSLEEAVEGANIVSGRGLLRRIAATPGLEKYTYWRFVAHKKNGIVFMCDDDQENNSTIKRDAKSEYHGLKFEQFVTRNKNESEPNPSPIVKLSEQFRTVCRYELNVMGRSNHTILLTGEIDALDEKENFVEIKLAKLNEEPDYLMAFNKCLTTWLQCTFSGIEDVVIGFKNEDGIVKKVKKIQKKDLLTTMCRHHPFRPDTNLFFLHSVLTKLMDVLEDGMTCVVEFQPQAKEAVLHLDPNRETILSEEFRKVFHIC